MSQPSEPGEAQLCPGGCPEERCSGISQKDRPRKPGDGHGKANTVNKRGLLLCHPRFFIGKPKAPERVCEGPSGICGGAGTFGNTEYGEEGTLGQRGDLQRNPEIPSSCLAALKEGGNETKADSIGPAPDLASAHTSDSLLGPAHVPLRLAWCP